MPGPILSTALIIRSKLFAFLLFIAEQARNIFLMTVECALVRLFFLVMAGNDPAQI
jgi:hypothetical protein